MTGLVISKWNTDLAVSRNHPRPEDVRRKVEEILRARLAPALSTAFESTGLSTRDDVLFIRRLDLDLELDTGWDSDDVARRWAGVIIGSVATHLDSAGANSLHFSTRAALLGQFVRDRAQNMAGNRWYYRCFDGLAMLPASAAIRTALLDVPGDGLAVLLSLPGDEVSSVLGALTDSDLRAMVSGVVAGNASREECAVALMEVWRDNPKLPARAALLGARLFLDVAKRRSDLVSRDLDIVARAFVRLITIADDGACDAVRQADVAALYRLLGAGAESLLPLLELPAELRSEMAAACTGAASETRRTSFGGIFILIPILEELFAGGEIEFWTRGAAAWLRVFVLMKCFGGPSAHEFCADPVVRDLLRAEEDLAEAVNCLAKIGDEQRERVTIALQVWRETNALAFEPASESDREFLDLPPEFTVPKGASELAHLLAWHVLRLFARKLPGFAQSSFPYLAAKFLEFPATVERQPAERRVQVRAGRPELGVILNMNGMLRQSYVPSWSGGEEWTVYPEA